MKPYYAFLAYKFLIDAKYEAGAIVDYENDIYALAASDNEFKTSIMIVNTGGKSKTVTVDVSELNHTSNIAVYHLNEGSNLKLSKKKSVDNILEVECEPNTVIVVDFI